MAKDFAEAANVASRMLLLKLKSEIYFAVPNSTTKASVDGILDQMAFIVILSEHLAPDIKIDEFVLNSIKEWGYRDRMYKYVIFS